MNRGPDPARQLLRALLRSAAAAGCTVELRHEAITPWASATFVGGQHRVAVLAGPDAVGWLTGLPDEELVLPGHYLASCAVAVADGRATLTLLILEA